MSSKSNAFGEPGSVLIESGKVRCTVLPRASMQGAGAGYSEAFLQDLIAECPAILPVKDYLPTTAALFSLGREIEVDIGGQSGFIDNLLVTNEGRLVLVETKLWRNPESTREVVAQILQYGMALSSLNARTLEAKIKLLNGRSIGEFLSGHEDAFTLIDDFDDALERQLRRGELLYLIASDGIRASVERIAHWLDEGGSAPFQFGMVELRFFHQRDDELLVVPRTLVRSREISRHVVVVDIQGADASTATATVRDNSKVGATDMIQTQRAIRASGPPMTRERLLSEVRTKKGDREADVAARILNTLDSHNFHSRSTPGNLQFGLLTSADQDSTFSALISLNPYGVWSHPKSEVIQILGDNEFVFHKQRMNGVSAFYRPQEANDPSKRNNDLLTSYSSLDGREEGLAQAIAITRDAVFAAVADK